MNFILVDQTSWIAMQNAIARIDKAVAQIATTVNAIKTEEDKIMNTVDDIQADVTAENTVIDSAVTLLKGLADALKAAGTDPAKLAALHTDITTKTQALADAVVANTPAPA